MYMPRNAVYRPILLPCAFATGVSSAENPLGAVYIGYTKVSVLVHVAIHGLQTELENGEELKHKVY